MLSTTNPKAKAWLLSAVVAGGMLVGAAGVANAATNDTSTTAAPAATAPAANSAAPAQDPATLPNGPGETLLTGTTADQVKAAAVAAVPGGTVIRVETDSAGSPYEAHVKKADGTSVTIKFDSNFQVTATEQGFGAHPAGQGPHDGQAPPAASSDSSSTTAGN
ncbi:MAG TPA: hypothetical protein VIJ47_04870 [Acidimicrobiales bacterium]